MSEDARTDETPPAGAAAEGAAADPAPTGTAPSGTALSGTALSGTALSDAARREALRRMTEGPELDVLVVGGGVVGAGCALDAVTRGLRTGIVEARDWASGTSSRSSKLVHGGLRYLEMFDFGLVFEALRERGLLLEDLAAHLVRPVSFLYPIQKRGWERWYVGAGILLYDLMAAASGRRAGLRWHRHLTRRGARRLAPALKRDALVGAIRYYDAQIDDARHTMEIVRTARAYGALAANRARVTSFLKEGERVVGAVVEDLDSGRRHEVRARQVINATGVWTDDTQRMVGERGQIKVKASKGVHLVVPRDRIHSTTGMILRTEKSVLFVIPWGRHWIVGTTDTPWTLDKAHPAATAADIEYVLEKVNEVLSTPLTREDVEGVYAGLRPLLSGESDSTSKLSREHTVAHPAPGLVVVAGGKYTTYRVMAEDAVDEAAHGLDRTIGPSVTANVPLLGAVGWPAPWNQRHLLAERSGLHVARIEHLVHRYGALTGEVLAIVEADRSLGGPLPEADDYLRAEAVYSARVEGARHIEDFLTRRTRISIETWDRGVAAAPVVAELMGEVLGWSDQRREDEVRSYVERVAAERASQELPDDEAADAARLEAKDIVLSA